MSKIFIHFEGIDPFDFPFAHLENWIERVVEDHEKELSEINYIFMSDDDLLDINRTYLSHDFYTDVITFDHSEDSREIFGDIYMSKDRIEENAKNLNIELRAEVNRVMVHGVLHLCGVQDKTSEEQKKMRAKEDAYLSLLSNV